MVFSSNRLNFFGLFCMFSMTLNTLVILSHVSMSLEQFAILLTGDSAQDIEPPVINSSKDSGHLSALLSVCVPAFGCLSPLNLVQALDGYMFCNKALVQEELPFFTL